MRSEPGQVCERQAAGVHMHVTPLDASRGRRKYLAGIKQPRGVERTLQALLLCQITLGKHDRHQVALFHAHTMFAREDATDLDAKLQDFAAERFRSLKFA